MIKSVFALIFSAVATFVFGIAGLILSFLAPGFVIRGAVRPWGKAVLMCCGVSLEVRGVENVPHEPSVIMYNHQSSLDIPALVASLPVERCDYKLVMKEEVAKIPFVGWVSQAAGHYFVSRDGGSGDSKQLKAMARGIRRKGHSVVLAPEGTRSESGRLLDFKKGGFMLAGLSGVPVVPMIIWGGKNVKKKSGQFVSTGGEMTVEFLPPFRPSDYSPGREGMEEIGHAVRGAMLEEVEKRLESEAGAGQ